MQQHFLEISLTVFVCSHYTQPNMLEKGDRDSKCMLQLRGKDKPNTRPAEVSRHRANVGTFRAQH